MFTSGRDINRLQRKGARLGTTDRGLEPHFGITTRLSRSRASASEGRGVVMERPRRRRRVGLVIAATLCGLAVVSSAAADPAPRLRTAADLDGVYFTLGPTGGAVYSRAGWDSGFGGEISVVRLRERELVGALGLGLGGIHFATADRGRVWADLQLGSRRLLGLGAGVSAGASAEIDAVIPPRWGAQATVWVFLGVIPYVRLGAVQKSGVYVDLGVKIALPVFRL